MQTEAEQGKMRMHVWFVRKQGTLLRMSAVASAKSGIAGVLFSAGSGTDV
jgi:hypothetical protein